MGDMGLDPVLVARALAGSLGPCSPSPVSLLPIQLVNRLAILNAHERLLVEHVGVVNRVFGQVLAATGLEFWSGIQVP